MIQKECVRCIHSLDTQMLRDTARYCVWTHKELYLMWMRADCTWAFLLTNRVVIVWLFSICILWLWSWLPSHTFPGARVLRFVSSPLPFICWICFGWVTPLRENVGILVTTERDTWTQVSVSVSDSNFLICRRFKNEGQKERQDEEVSRGQGAGLILFFFSVSKKQDSRWPIYLLQDLCPWGLSSV